MSEKKNKEIKIPVYDIQGQLAFIEGVCKDFDFDVKKLLPLILADWIRIFQLGCSKMNGNAYESFICYLKSTQRTFDDLKKIREYVQNGNKQ